jgi:hypothetical protein
MGRRSNKYIAIQHAYVKWVSFFSSSLSERVIFPQKRPTLTRFLAKIWEKHPTLARKTAPNWEVGLLSDRLLVVIYGSTDSLHRKIT